MAVWDIKKLLTKSVGLVSSLYAETVSGIKETYSSFKSEAHELKETVSRHIPFRKRRASEQKAWQETVDRAEEAKKQNYIDALERQKKQAENLARVIEGKLKKLAVKEQNFTVPPPEKQPEMTYEKVKRRLESETVFAPEPERNTEAARREAKFQAELEQESAETRARINEAQEAWKKVRRRNAEYSAEQAEADKWGIEFERYMTDRPYGKLKVWLEKVRNSRLIKPDSVYTEEQFYAFKDIYDRARKEANAEIMANGRRRHMTQEEVGASKQRWAAIEDDYYNLLIKFFGRERLRDFFNEHKNANNMGASTFFHNERAQVFENFRRAAVERQLFELVDALDRGGADFAQFLYDIGFRWEQFYIDENGDNVERGSANQKLIELTEPYLYTAPHGENLQQLWEDLGQEVSEEYDDWNSKEEW